MSGKTDILRIKSAEVIASPKEIKLLDRLLTWTIRDRRPDFGEEVAPLDMRDCLILGCLEDFVGLADGSPKDVFAFVKKYGVLGVRPTVKERLIANGERRYLDYEEHICIYTELARIANNILRILRMLKDGHKVTKTAVAECLPSRIWFNPVGKHIVSDEVYNSAEAYQLLITAIQYWWEAAQIKAELIYPKRIDASSAAKTPEIQLGFGRWSDGFWWDYRLKIGEQTEPYEADEQKRLIEMYERLSPGWGKWRYQASLLPSIHQRPSPLFNALTLQLLKMVTLPDGGYFCDHCGRWYLHDNTKGNKPRPDKKSAFCTQDCKREYEQEYERNRYQIRKTKAH